MKFTIIDNEPFDKKLIQNGMPKRFVYCYNTYASVRPFLLVFAQSAIKTGLVKEDEVAKGIAHTLFLHFRDEI